MMTLRMNDQEYELDVPYDIPLLWALRDIVGLTGTKFGCGVALCGACTVHLDGRAIRSCITPVSHTVGKSVTTVEAIGETSSGRRFSKPGSISRWFSVAIASRARSCLRRLCWQVIPASYDPKMW
jgi:isoquinoline 1-oxidoreductase subunit alpha